MQISMTLRNAISFYFVLILTITGCTVTWKDISDTNYYIVAERDGDYASIQEALNDNRCLYGSPCVIKVMPGLYLENIKIPPGSYIHLQGAGPNLTRIRGSDGSIPIIDIDDVTGSLGTVSRVTISGFSVGCNDSSVNHCSKGIRIEVISGSQITIANNVVEESLNRFIDGISVEMGSPKILYNLITDCTAAGVFVNNDDLNGAAAEIANNKFFDNFRGVWSYGHAQIEVSRNEFKRNRVGVLCSPATLFAPSALIVDNLLDGGNRGVHVTGGKAQIERNAIRGSQEGIKLEGESEARVIENQLYYNGNGIRTFNSTAPHLFLRNNIMESGGDGIRLSSSSETVRLVGNTIIDSNLDGLILDNYRKNGRPNAIISHNVATNNGGVGIRVRDCVNGSHVTVTHNVADVYALSIVCVEAPFNSVDNGAVLSFP